MMPSLPCQDANASQMGPASSPTSLSDLPACRRRLVVGGLDGAVGDHDVDACGGIGIHGTSQDDSIGTRASHGCIRMHVPDVIELFGRVPTGTPY
jgi:hypothetical protein